MALAALTSFGAILFMAGVLCGNDWRLLGKDDLDTHVWHKIGQSSASGIIEVGNHGVLHLLQDANDGISFCRWTSVVVVCLSQPLPS